MSEIVAEGIIEAKALREYIDVFTPIVSEGKIHWNDDGLTARVVEAATVAMISPAKLSVEYFESYDSPGAVTIGLDFNKLLERIKPADSNQLVHLAVDMETRKLQIKYGNADISMALIDTDSIRQEPDVPDLDLPNWMVVEGQELKRAYEITDIVTDHLYLRGKPDERVVEVAGQGDVDNTTVTLGQDETIEASVDEETESVFPLEFVEDVLEPIPDGAEVRVTFGSEYPMILEYEGLDGHLSASVFLAPRIVSE